MGETILQVAVNGLLLGGIYALIAIGLTLIFGVVRIINFAQGEFLMIGMFATFWAFGILKIDPYIALFIFTPLLFILGMATERVVIKPIQNAPPLAQIFSTFGLSILLQNGALMLWKSDYRSIETAYSNAVINWGGLLINVPRLVAFLVAVGIVLLLYFFLQRTYLGKAMNAVAQDREAAQLMGVDINKIYMLAFGVGIGLEGLAGALIMPIYSTYPTVGFTFGLIAFVVVVLGGLGNMIGAFLGGLIIGLVESFSGFFISPELNTAIYFLIFVLVLIIRPSGLMGIVGAEEMGLK
jgi:branched-chain amino acid transport system permease protein